jgi:hypothetical protein
MRVLLAACVDPRVVEVFSSHEVKTAGDMGWHHLKDDAPAAKLKGRFDVLVIMDQGFEKSQIAQLRLVDRSCPEEQSGVLSTAVCTVV